MGWYTVGAVDLRLAVTVKVEPYPISLSGGHAVSPVCGGGYVGNNLGKGLERGRPN